MCPKRSSGSNCAVRRGNKGENKGDSPLYFGDYYLISDSYAVRNSGIGLSGSCARDPRDVDGLVSGDPGRHGREPDVTAGMKMEKYNYLLYINNIRNKGDCPL